MIPCSRISIYLQGGLTGRKVSNGKTPSRGVNDPSVCLQYQNQIKTMYRMGTTSPQEGATSEVCVTALSDSDTPVSQAQSPVSLGSSSASERLQKLIDAESYELSFSGSGDKHENKLNSLEHHSGLFVVAEESTENIHTMEKVTELKSMDQNFTRNSQTRNSDISNDSSISQGIQADHESGKQESDMSDISVNGEGKPTQKNHTDLETFLHHTDESGIVSETTSSNHSGSSHQEDQSNFAFDPAEIAQKIILDVSEQKTALDSMQNFSMIQSHQQSMMLRHDFMDQVVKTTDFSSNQSTSVSDSSTASPSNVVQAKAAFFTNNQSAFTSPSHRSKVPPPVATKPTFQSNAANFRNLSANVTNLSTLNDSMASENPKTSAFTAHVQVSTPVSVYTTQAIVVSKKDSFSSTNSGGTTMSFSSFRPAGKPGSMDNVTHLSAYRPDSTTSTSSYCSTPSSVKSVIYKPYPDQQGSDSPCVVSYDSSCEPISESPSLKTDSPTVIVKDNTSDSSRNKRDSSPALSICSSASSKGGKQKKKVSFSDSEPSDTPSPVNTSLSSNQLSYFDMKQVDTTKSPKRLNSLNSSLSSQFSQQSSSNNSIDGLGMSSGHGNGQRPPPPSYQYALKNSSVLGKSIDRGNQLISQNPRHSSNSSLSSSLDESNVVTAKVGIPPLPNKPTAQQGAMISSQGQNFPSLPSQPQNSSPHTGQPAHFQNMPQIKPLTLTSFQQPGNSTPSPSQGQPPLYPRSTRFPQSPSKNTVLPRRQPPPIPGTCQQDPSLSYGLGPVSASRSVVHRQPLSSDLSPEEYIPPSPVHSSTLPSPRSPAHSSSLPYPQSLAHYPFPKDFARSFGQTGNQNVGQGQRFSNEGQSISSHNALQYLPSASSQISSSPKIAQQEFSRPINSDISQRYPLNSLNLNHNNGSTIGKQTSPSHRGSQSSLFSNQSRTSSVSNIATDSNSTHPTVLRNPPVPPARIDSWSTMDKQISSVQNGPGQLNGQGNQDYLSNNLPSRNMTGPQYSTRSLPFHQDKVMNQSQMVGLSGQNDPGNYGPALPPHANGSISNFQQYPTNPVINNHITGGQLRRVDLGSEKRSFTKTNVLHASKC